jgi:hypothetical protein
LVNNDALFTGIVRGMDSLAVKNSPLLIEVCPLFTKSINIPGPALFPSKQPEHLP